MTGEVQPISRNSTAILESNDWERTAQQARQSPSVEHKDGSFAPSSFRRERGGIESPTTPKKVVSFSVSERAPSPSKRRSQPITSESISSIEGSAQEDQPEATSDEDDGKATPPPPPEADLPTPGDSVWNLSGQVTKLVRHPMFEGTYSSVYKGLYNQHEVCGFSCIWYLD